MSERELTLRPADRLTGRDMLRELDRRHGENLSRTPFALDVPPQPRRSWWLDPRYGC